MGCSPGRPSQGQELQLSVLPQPHPPERGDSQGWRGRPRPLRQGGSPLRLISTASPRQGAEPRSQGLPAGRDTDAGQDLYSHGSHGGHTDWARWGSRTGTGAGQRLPPHPGSSPQRGTVLRPSSVLEGDRLDPQVLVQGGLSCKKPVSGATSRSQQLLWWAVLLYPALWSSQNPHPPCHPQTPFFHGSEGLCCSPARCCACQAGHQSRSPQDPAPSCWLPQWQSGGWEPRQLMQGPGKGGTGQRPTSSGRPGPLPPFLPRHSLTLSCSPGPHRLPL